MQSSSLQSQKTRTSECPVYDSKPFDGEAPVFQICECGARL